MQVHDVLSALRRGETTGFWFTVQADFTITQVPNFKRRAPSSHLQLLDVGVRLLFFYPADPFGWASP